MVEDLNEEAESVIQQATAALFDGGQNMCTLLAAQEVNEWGSTLAQIAQCATIRRWSLPQLAGAMSVMLSCSVVLSSVFASPGLLECHGSVHALFCDSRHQVCGDAGGMHHKLE